MSIYDPTEVDYFKAMLALTISLKVMDRFTSIGIGNQTQLHIAVITILQQITIIKGIDKLFKDVQHTEETNESLHRLTSKIVEMCEEHISEMLEGAKK